ncbi:galactokinase [Croceiramulus getboli]|nr:galactokinase [Flavobacteriaceae bacterium YJPT1-3]
MSTPAVANPATLRISSPGRINLIGEHIDYNGGHVLPAAIDKRITLDFKELKGDTLYIHSLDHDQSMQTPLGTYRVSQIEWENYILGVLYFIDRLRPKVIGAFECRISSQLPSGSGLSSSAALTCGLAKGLNELFELELTDLQIMEVAQKAEHEFVGTQCGIMDQFSVVKGQKNTLILLNCQDRNFSYIPAHFEPYKVVLLNTNVAHHLASSEYNVRREQCEQALAIINKSNKNFTYLCDVPLAALEQVRLELSDELLEKAQYIIEENQRCLQASKALKDQDLITFGALMYQSHYGLRDQYQVSCAELDFLVAVSEKLDTVVGSRMMGGGFGGCTINLVHEDAVDAFIEQATRAYKDTFNTVLTPLVINISDGVKQIQS